MYVRFPAPLEFHGKWSNLSAISKKNFHPDLILSCRPIYLSGMVIEIIVVNLKKLVCFYFQWKGQAVHYNTMQWLFKICFLFFVFLGISSCVSISIWYCLPFHAFRHLSIAPKFRFSKELIGRSEFLCKVQTAQISDFSSYLPCSLSALHLENVYKWGTGLQFANMMCQICIMIG